MGVDLEGVVWALGELRDEKAVEPLAGLLGDDDWMVREEVAIALGKIGGPGVVEPLRRLLRDPHRVVRQAARKALKQIKKGARKTRGS
ncbi:MAG: HEAT repeat domain-containing protein [Candidatus Freyarchaeota archaeon]